MRNGRKQKKFLQLSDWSLNHDIDNARSVHAVLCFLPKLLLCFTHSGRCKCFMYSTLVSVNLKCNDSSYCISGLLDINIEGQNSQNDLKYICQC